VTTTYSFTLVLSELSEVTVELADRVYGRISDALLSSSHGEVTLNFDREARSLPEAIESAIRDLQELGIKVSW
jgi:hypothetical protein